MSDDNRISRREAIGRVGTMLGGAGFVGGASLLQGCVSYDPAQSDQGLFSQDEVAVLDEIADTILPPTDTPGAKAAGVGQFMAVMVNDTYYPPEQMIFRDGLVALEKACLDNFDCTVLEATPAQRATLVSMLDREQFDYMNGRLPGQPVHYFRMIKELTLLGYFTSEIGYTQAMRYQETPGRFDPCVRMQPGDTLWADHA